MSRLIDACAALVHVLDVAVHGGLGAAVTCTGLTAVAQQPGPGDAAVVIVGVGAAVGAILVPPLMRWSTRQRVTPAQPAEAVTRG